MVRSLPKPVLILTIVALIAINVLVWRAGPPAGGARRALTVSVFETGTARGVHRAVLAITPSGKTLLIDANSDASILRALGNALPFWHRSLDVVIPLKAGAGMTEVKNRYHITKIVPSLTRGARLNFHDGTFVDVLWPPVANTDAPVLRISYGTTSFLIEPIVSARIEKYLASVGSSLPPPSFIISSSTPAGVFVSNGVAIH